MLSEENATKITHFSVEKNRVCYTWYAYPRTLHILPLCVTWSGGYSTPTFQTRMVWFLKFSVQNGAFSAISNDFRYRIWLKMYHSV